MCEIFITFIKCPLLLLWQATLFNWNDYDSLDKGPHDYIIGWMAWRFWRTLESNGYLIAITTNRIDSPWFHQGTFSGSDQENSPPSVELHGCNYGNVMYYLRGVYTLVSLWLPAFGLLLNGLLPCRNCVCSLCFKALLSKFNTIAFRC